MVRTRAATDRSALLQWVIVLGVGGLVVAVVLGLNLIPRLNAGQKVLNGARPAFQTQSLKADVAGIGFISTDVNMAAPLITPAGGGASEVPHLIAFVASKTGLSDTQVLAALSKNFPAATHLLQALPLSADTAEIPKLVSFLGTTLHLSDAQVLAALKANFPALYQAIANLPTVTNGWYDIPGASAANFTNFDHAPVRSVPQLRDYFKDELIPAVGAQQSNFNSLDGTSKLTWIAPVLLIIGGVVMIFALLMIALHLRGGLPRPVAMGTAGVVPLVGVIVVVLALVLALIPRTDNGQKLLDGLKPAFAANRVAGDRAGVQMVASIISMENPIMTASGGAAAEVPKLIGFVSSKTGLSDKQVLAALNKNFPAITNLLEALPLSRVSAEVPKLVGFLGTTLHLSDAQVLAALKANFPGLAAAITNLPAVTGGWNDVPGMAGLHRFNGAPIRTAVDVQNYFGKDVIPVLETQQRNYTKLMTTSKINFIGPVVLIVGIVVILFGLLMVFLAGLRHTGSPLADGESAARAAPTTPAQPAPA